MGHVQKQLMARAYEWLGSWIPPRDLEDIGLERTSQDVSCEDEMQNVHTFLQQAEKLEPTPEVGNQYIRAEKCFLEGI